jgi:hypothetical protein
MDASLDVSIVFVHAVHSPSRMWNTFGDCSTAQPWTRSPWEIFEGAMCFQEGTEQIVDRCCAVLSAQQSLEFPRGWKYEPLSYQDCRVAAVWYHAKAHCLTWQQWQESKQSNKGATERSKPKRSTTPLAIAQTP